MKTQTITLVCVCVYVLYISQQCAKSEVLMEVTAINSTNMQLHGFVVYNDYFQELEYSLMSEYA